MINLHTHTLLSDGELLPSEVVRRAEALGYTAIALTDHVDSSNIDFVLFGLVKVCRILNRYWDIVVLPGVEVTHAPVEEIGQLVRRARSLGAQVVVGHGETTWEPVIPGTNRAAIEAGVDLLAHPGRLTHEDALLAKRKGVLLEITTRSGHSATNRHVVRVGLSVGAKLVINTDAHSFTNLVPREKARAFLKNLGLKNKDIEKIFNNAREFLRKRGTTVRNQKKLIFS